MQCNNKKGKMKHFTNRKFPFAEGEVLDIPTDFSGINGWHVSQTGVTEVCFFYIYICFPNS